MAEPRNSPQRNIGVWPLVLAAAAIIAAAVWFFMSVDVEEPVPTPDSPAATGTAGQPAGTTGEGPKPGAPAGTDAPAQGAAAKP